jgi:hypothetical protein
MRSFLVIAIMLGVLDAAAAADDNSPVAGKLPDNERSQQTYLFTLKKNGISLRMSPDQFCRDLGYGAAVARSDDPTGKTGYWDQGHPELKDDGKTQVPGELAWVICQYPKSKAKSAPEHQ